MIQFSLFEKRFIAFASHLTVHELNKKHKTSTYQYTMDRIYQKTKIESKAMQIKNRKYIYNDMKAAACLISAGANTRKKRMNDSI